MNAMLLNRSRSAVPSPSSFGPGNVVGVILKKLGYGEMTPDCGCKAFARKMNDWGWPGCLTTHRQEIIDWFILKARQRGIHVDKAGLWSLRCCTGQTHWHCYMGLDIGTGGQTVFGGFFASDLCNNPVIW